MGIKTRKVDTSIVALDGTVVFEKKDFEVPESWTDQAAMIASSKYATADEYSVLDIINRIVNKITMWGLDYKYFDAAAANDFSLKLFDILVNQKAAFNSPIFMNIGVPGVPQVSAACFIGDIEDTMEDILAHNHRAGMIFRSGAGIGVNISKLRGEGEPLSNRGSSSGPISFMRAWDASAAAIKSGGRTRRSAVLLAMDVDHPDVEEFINCKSAEEKKAKALIEAGYSREEANATIDFQNANHSIVLTDEFMNAVKRNRQWKLYNRVGGSVAKKLKAKDLLRTIAQRAWETGDPGLQFRDTINAANPIPNTGEIQTSNPCGEVYAISYSSCLLAAINILKYINRIDRGQYLLDTIALERDVEILTTALDIMIEGSDYPDPRFEKVAKATRPIGIGISNFATALMVSGIKYDSEEGRDMGRYIYQNISSFAANASIKLANTMGPFKEFPSNVNETIKAITNVCLPVDRTKIKNLIKKYGIRNSQLTTAMPCGTVGLLLDCDSFSIEPIFRKESVKSLVGGGELKLIPKCIEHARKEGYPEEVICDASTVHWSDHIRMVSALQDGISQGISKTINMPNSATVDDVKEAYLMAWELGCKGITVYRDGSKTWQPMNAAKEEKEVVKKEEKKFLERRKLPDDRPSSTHHFDIAGFEGYLTASTYPGTNDLGEIFIRASKAGSPMQGMLDSFATVVSIALQYGVPLEKLIEKFTNTGFAPSGITKNPNIRFCSSVTDYIFKFLKQKFIDVKEVQETIQLEKVEVAEEVQQTYDGPPCLTCGQITQRSGSCYLCLSCGLNGGCSS
jgi:ribonucleoside-diphosphate reductase alpha chain